jgi:hypothetical protein
MTDLVHKTQDLIFQTFLGANRQRETKQIWRMVEQRPVRRSMAWLGRKERDALQVLDGKTE